MKIYKKKMNKRTGITKEKYHHIMHSGTITVDEAIKRLDAYRYTQNFLFTSDNKVIDIAIQAIKDRQLIIDILKIVSQASA